ncbi:MAG: cytochrome c3 family protein [Candidatus Hodarchaeota archaeon]
MQKRRNFMPGLVLALAILLVGTSSLFAQVQITDCMDCHNDTTVITDKKTGMSESMHGTGDSYGRGTSRSCAACHSGGAFSKMVADGLTPDTVEAGDLNPTRQDCRACHQVHTSYTVADWALETTAPVTLYALEDAVYDGGKGNLCANCHQPRRAIDAADPNGMINVSSTHWGPHHGPQSAMILGLGGAGDVVGRPGAHTMLVRDTCVTCHIGENNSHTFEAVEASCVVCHSDADGFDVGGLQTEVAALIAELGELLKAKGLLDEEGHPVVGDYPAAQASALWNYIFIEIEDGSLGVHNPGYTKDLLEASIAALQ